MNAAQVSQPATVAGLMDVLDWSVSPVGSPETWSQTLRTAVDLILKADAQIVLFWGPDFVALYNDAYAPTIGDKHPRALGRPAVENWSELWDDLGPLLRGVRDTGETFAAKDRPFYIERRGGEGETVYFDVSYSAAPEVDGSVGGVLCIVSETTERVRAAAALRENEARLQQMADSIPQIVWISDPTGVLEFVNRQFTDYTGKQLGRVKGQDVALDFMHPDDVAPVIETFERAIATGQAFEIEHRVRSATGEWRWFLDRAEPHADPGSGKLARWFGVATDIHDRKVAESALRELNDTLQQRVAAATAERDTAWRNARDMIAVVDREGRFRAISPAAMTILGWSPEELVGRDAFDFIHPDDHDYTRGKLADSFAAPLPATENRFRHKDGSWRTISWVTAPEGEVIYSYGRDVTEDRAKAEALAAAQAQLHEMQKMETLGQLTGGVAHDFNNLLTPIVGALDLLSRRLGDDDRAKRLTEGGLQAAERARLLVDRLLTFSRRQHLESRPVEICKLVGGMGEILSRSLGPRIHLETHCPEDLPCVSVDPNQLELALLNLAVNARDAMPEGGELLIRAARVPWTDNPNLVEGDYVRLDVIDTGMGMDAETLKRAVEPFFTTKEVGKGTGLGLSSVHGLAAQSGGDFRMESEPARGTTASLWLPLARDVAHDSEPAPARAPAARGDEHGTVLLVDDEALVRSGTAEMLADAGYEVVQVGSGVEALLRARVGLHFDVLVTDYAMPDMTGVELVRELRRLRPRLPVLMITGYASLSEAEAEGLPRLAKPFVQSELVAALTSTLQTGRKPPKRRKTPALLNLSS